MAKTVYLTCILDDGSPPVAGFAPPKQGQPVMLEYGENAIIHMRLFTPQGKPIYSASQKVITYGARRGYYPQGQLLFQHLGTVATIADGGWDCPVVPNDYKLITEGFGRFQFDMWLTDNSVNPPQSNPVQPLSPFIVTPAAVSVTSPSTAPVPSQVVAYGLPTPSPSGTFLQALGVSGGLSSLAWQNPPVFAAWNAANAYNPGNIVSANSGGVTLLFTNIVATVPGNNAPPDATHWVQLTYPVQHISASVTGASGMSFIFTKGPSAYIKNPAALTAATGPSLGFVSQVYLPDIDNGNGTKTGAVLFSAPFTGTVDISILGA